MTLCLRLIRLWVRGSLRVGGRATCGVVQEEPRCYRVLVSGCWSQLISLLRLDKEKTRTSAQNINLPAPIVQQRCTNPVFSRSTPYFVFVSMRAKYITSWPTHARLRARATARQHVPLHQQNRRPLSTKTSALDPQNSFHFGWQVQRDGTFPRLGAHPG